MNANTERYIRSDAIESALAVTEGQAALFLAVLAPDGTMGERTPLGKVATGTFFAPLQAQEIKGQRYILCLRKGDTTRLQMASPDASVVVDTLSTILYELTQVKPAIGSPEQFLPLAVDYAMQAKRERALRWEQNDLLTRRAFSRKLDEIGEVGNLHLGSLQEKPDVFGEALIEIARIFHYKKPEMRELHELQKKSADLREGFVRYARSNHWRFREVILRSSAYKEDAGTILAFWRGTRIPVVLQLKSTGSTYRLGRRTRELTAKELRQFEPTGYCFYEAFPKEENVWKMLFLFVKEGFQPTYQLLRILGFIASAIGFMLPIATRFITESIIPTADYGGLVQLTLMLLVLTVSQVAISGVPTLVILLYSTRFYERFQAAMFDHILRVPVNRFRDYDSGELAQRLLSVSRIQETVFRVISKEILGAAFSVASLLMMFWYSPLLASVGLALLLIFIVAFGLFARYHLVILTRYANTRAKICGFLKQFFEGILKIRAAGAESRVLLHYMENFGQATKDNFAIGLNTAIQSIVTMALPLLMALLFYSLVGFRVEDSLTVPVFLAFVVAFQTFAGGLMALAHGIWALLSIKPEFDFILRIVETKTEDEASRKEAGKLDGSLEISHVQFRYRTEMPLVLNDVSLKARAGEFIAIAGSSGSGKSTLVRLMLGFEKPEAGAVYYSGKDLVGLRASSVRSQVGVIMQNGKLLPGSILQNIVYGTDYTMADAWDALRLACLDEEVRNMPMGIHTLVTPATVSGGQQQRLLIARSLVGKPPIIVLDESTSALDNVTQSLVMKNLMQLHSTLIVVAHRLSTIRDADRIYVLDDGQVVQTGTYTELAGQPGLFKRLVERQLAEEEK